MAKPALGWDPITGKHLPVLTFRPRFVPEAGVAELSNLWHLSRMACAGDATRYKRMIWTSGEYAKAHPETSSTGAYKDLDDMLSFGGR